MLILLQALIQLLLAILIGMTTPLTLTVFGAAVVAGFLWLAAFPWKRNISTLVGTWIFAGLLSSFFYSLLIYTAPVLKGTVFMFITALSLGVLPFFFLRKIRAPKNKLFRWWVLYAVWLYCWFTILVGWRYGLGGIIFITLPAFIIAVGMAFILAGKILPFPDPDIYLGENPPPEELVPTFKREVQELIALFKYPENGPARKDWIRQRRMALRALISYALGTHYNYYVVIDEKISARVMEEGEQIWLPWDKKRIERLKSGDLRGDFLAGPGIILTGCDHAVALTTGVTLKGTRGPGVIFTGSGEEPTHILDLRGQLLAFMVEARTRDGIPIKVPTATPFRIDAGKQQVRLGAGFPYRAGAVFRAIRAQPAEHKDPSQNPEKQDWYDLPRGVAERAVRDALSHYAFDELYDPNKAVRAQIGKRLAQELEKEFKEWGLCRIGSGVGNLEPSDPAALKKRVAGWQAGWQRKIRLDKARREHEKQERIDKVLADERRKLILNLGRRIKTLRDEHVPMDKVALALLNILEVMSTNSVLHPLVSLRPEDVIRRVYRVFGAEEDAEGKTGG